MTTPRFIGVLSQALATALLCAVPLLAQAAFVPFNAVVDGVSQIIEVIDQTGPVVRVQTLAFGGGSLGSLTYHSGDELNLATGQGTGSNRFVTDDGDELFGTFSMQMVPGADPSRQTAALGGAAESGSAWAVSPLRPAPPPACEPAHCATRSR